MLEGKMMPRFMLVRPANGKANNQDAESQQKSRKHGEFGWDMWISWASQVALVVKNLPAYARDIKETRVRSLGGEDPWRRAW